MHRRTRHRRRFHTDRIVAVRRARYLREIHPLSLPEEWLGRKLAYGRLASIDPWDCGRPNCGLCHWDDGRSRGAERKAWREDWGI